MTAHARIGLIGVALLLLFAPGCDQRKGTPPPPQANQQAAPAPEPAQDRSPAAAPAPIPAPAPVRAERDEDPDLPEGYQAYRDAQGSGRVLIAQQQQARSAKDLLLTALDDLEDYFDDRPQLRGAFADKQGRQIQALFAAERDDAPVEGVLLARFAGREGTLVVAYDQPKALPQSLQRLLTIANQKSQPATAGRNATEARDARDAREMPAAQEAPAAQMARGAQNARGAREARDEDWRQWPLVRLPDGSGSLRLPEGWRIIASNKGMADVAGPDDTLISLGIWIPINLPGSVMPQVAQGLYFAPYCGPADALTALWAQRHRNESPRRLTRIIEQTPIPWQNGQAAYVHWEWEVAQRTPDGQPAMQKRHSLALIATMPTSRTTWVYYFTEVTAPEPAFGQHLPTMLHIWQSWKVSDAVYLERMNKALANLKEANAMIQSSSAERERVAENAHADWTEAFRGERYERDTLTGEMRTQSLHDIRDIVEAKNRQEGYQRYEEVPLRDLNR